MQDGQNLFDAYYSFAGEWMIDESMNALFENGDDGAIVVGIDNGGAHRINEYSPWVNSQYGGGNGEAYAAFLVQTLKPYIDTHFRTLPDREYTAIGGSSLGANISMYAAIEYQEVFSKVGIFSPAFWFSDSSYLHVQDKGIHMDMRIYFVAGQNESSTMISNMAAMYDALADAGQDETEMLFISSPDGAHSEWFWAREYPDAYTWLFEDIVLSDLRPMQTMFSVLPNPASHYIYLPAHLTGQSYTLYSVVGQQVTTDAIHSSRIDTSWLREGLYIILVTDHFRKTVHASRFVKH
jgi:metallo-beta-lactamase class B